MTREELRAHCQRQIEGCEMFARWKGEEPHGKVYEEHKLILELLDQEPRKGHWINKLQSDEDESCNAECSSCHKRSDGYTYEYGYGLKFIYPDFCPKCGSNNREVEK